eukprot:5356904-Pyramimonas_sp.AAC.1
MQCALSVLPEFPRRPTPPNAARPRALAAGRKRAAMIAIIISHFLPSPSPSASSPSIAMWAQVRNALPGASSSLSQGH